MPGAGEDSQDSFQDLSHMSKEQNGSMRVTHAPPPRRHHAEAPGRGIQRTRAAARMPGEAEEAGGDSTAVGC